MPRLARRQPWVWQQRHQMAASSRDAESGIRSMHAGGACSGATRPRQLIRHRPQLSQQVGGAHGPPLPRKRTPGCAPGGASARRLHGGRGQGQPSALSSDVAWGPRQSAALVTPLLHMVAAPGLRGAPGQHPPCGHAARIGGQQEGWYPSSAAAVALLMQLLPAGASSALRPRRECGNAARQHVALHAAGVSPRWWVQTGQCCKNKKHGSPGWVPAQADSPRGSPRQSWAPLCGLPAAPASPGAGGRPATHLPACAARRALLIAHQHLLAVPRRIRAALAHHHGAPQAAHKGAVAPPGRPLVASP